MGMQWGMGGYLCPQLPRDKQLGLKNKKLTLVRPPYLYTFS